MPTTESVSTTGVNHFAASGNSSRQKRSMPYVPTLSSTPTSSTAAPAGACPAASGSQVWNGTSGALIAKATKKPRNSHLAVVGSMCSLVSSPNRKVSVALPGRHDVQRDDRGEHQQPAEQGVQQELHRGVRALRAAVGPDDEVHRDQHGLEEHVEQEDVGRREDADHHGFEGQQQREVGLHRALRRLVDAAACAPRRARRPGRPAAPGSPTAGSSTSATPSTPTA